ncbi:Oligopeptide ABC transporter, periplasmic oligopeptide-binding protein OppA [Lachnospiraceae bacterium TWA4]|nr:Oligopeptide ABC transporter, periplasmic oligopeptide-binding protein OppA [Lachnospiraceae bacterium TWA4]
MKKNSKKILCGLLSAGLVMGSFTACSGGGTNETKAPAGTQAADNSGSASKTSFVMGDTTFNAENEEADVNPHNTYAGWACIRYGVGETLFKYSDNMEIEPWVAKSFENVNETTWKITLNDNVTFSNGKKVRWRSCKEVFRTFNGSSRACSW